MNLDSERNFHGQQRTGTVEVGWGQDGAVQGRAALGGRGRLGETELGWAGRGRLGEAELGGAGLGGPPNELGQRMKIPWGAEHPSS